MVNVPPFRASIGNKAAGEWLTKDGADLMAMNLAAAWHVCGHTTVKAWSEPFVGRTGRGTQTLYAVKTNLVAGLPPQERYDDGA